MSEVLVIALMGLPGAGKSTLARALTEQLPAREVNRDRIRAALFPECRFTDVEKRAANAALLRAVEANCALSVASVVDGMTFSRRAELEALRDRVAACGGAVLPLYLECPIEVAVARVAGDAASGSHPAADRSEALVREVARRFEPPPPDALRLDATRAPGEIAAAALAALRAARAGC